MKTIEELIAKLSKNQMDYNVFIKFNAKTPLEKTSLTNLIRKAISDGYIQKTDSNLLKVTKAGHLFINPNSANKEAVKTPVHAKKININIDNAKLDSEIIADAYNIKLNFSDDLLKLAENINNNANFNDTTDRVDLRSLKTVTIDSEHSKDLDDAFSIERVDDNYKVYVHISDVSHFIEPNSPLDIEAKKRGNSTYLIDKVYNMFPEILSNGIISLNEKVDRFTLTLICVIDKDGNILQSDVVKSIINSDKKLSYNYVEDIINKKANDEDWLMELINNALKVKNILHKKRSKGVDFENDDINIVLDDNGVPIEFYAEEKKESMLIIESLMLLANSEIAKKLKDYEGVIYRYHGAPDNYRFNNFKILAHNKGYELKKLDENNYDLIDFLEKIKGKSEEKLLTGVLMRSMTPSSYSVINKSHFGLGFDYYTYFTSPIRRYVDLTIHRIVKDYIIDKKTYTNDDNKYKSVADECTLLDRTSKKAERNLRQIKAARYMKDRLGDEYYGFISLLSRNGITVEIEGLDIEGFIEATYVGANYRFYEDMQSIYIDKVKMYELGDRVKVFVVKANIETGKIYFSL
ncbi:RNB domain-containing ribonuclease [Brachyspira pilosicoli]|uniref:RNB domain-containing ribonuclease n=1 Tax=Brachyspira pilosicoli TaxID=52584 RepID=UPI0012F4AA31|nr:RNB domain-containing ribonuclease [Brachyspira pilosicoli]